jgi:hypothetical protein
MQLNKESIGEFKRPIREILKDFQKPIPKRFIKSKTLKGNRIDFVPWYNLCKLLEYFAPGYEWSVKIDFCDSQRTYVTGTLTIHAEEGTFSRSATGNEMSDCNKFGDPSSNAEAMSLRRACAKFGLGLHVGRKFNSPS